MSEWISVEDSLPKKYNHLRTVNVLLWIPKQPNSPILIGYGLMKDGVNYPYTIKDWRSTDTGSNLIFSEPTHWMPLPEPPKETNNDKENN